MFCQFITCFASSLLHDNNLLVWHWLMKVNGNLLNREAGRSSSFGEMLFLIAIHFHGNHMHAIAELVCSTLGMKVSTTVFIYGVSMVK